MKAFVALALLVPTAASAQDFGYQFEDPPWMYREAIPEDISAGAGFTCVVTDCGNVECWGTLPPGVPAHIEGDYKQAAAGYHQMCARDAAGYVDCWGNGVAGNTSPPNVKFTQIDGAYAHTCGIEGSTGAIRCWGLDIEAAQGGDPVHPGNNQAGPYKQVSTSLRHTCALHDLGFVECWGSDLWDRAHGLEPSELFYTASSENISGFGVAAGNDVVSTGLNHTAVRSDWAVYSMGEDAHGEVTTAGSPTVPGVYAHGQFLNSDVYPQQITAGAHHTCVRYRIDGGGRNHVLCWGDDAYGQSSPPEPPEIRQELRLQDISAGWWHTCGITTDDEVSCWGDTTPAPPMTCKLDLGTIPTLPNFNLGG